jgi:hypothetical protein
MQTLFPYINILKYHGFRAILSLYLKQITSNQNTISIYVYAFNMRTVKPMFKQIMSVEESAQAYRGSTDQRNVM